MMTAWIEGRVATYYVLKVCSGGEEGCAAL